MEPPSLETGDAPLIAGHPTALPRPTPARGIRRRQWPCRKPLADRLHERPFGDEAAVPGRAIGDAERRSDVAERDPLQPARPNELRVVGTDDAELNGPGQDEVRMPVRSRRRVGGRPVAP